MERLAQLAAAGGPVFLLAFFRIAGVMMLAPVFGSQITPAPVKIFVSLVLALLFFPVLGVKELPGAMDGPALALALAGELAVGLIIGFASAMLFAGVRLGGHLIDQELGLLSANILDPILDEQVSILGQFKVLLATAVYLLIDGHHLLIGALSDSFRLVPMLGLRFGRSAALQLSDSLMRDVFRMGIEIAAPALVTLFLVTVAAAFMARTAPELNIFSLSFTVRLAVGLLVVALGVGLFVAGFESREIQQSAAVRMLVGMLGGAR